MPKKKFTFKVFAYDKENNFFGSCLLRTYTYDEAFSEFMEICKLLTEGQFSYVTRLEFVSGFRVLFVFCSLCHIVNQHNLTIKFNCYE